MAKERSLDELRVQVDPLQAYVGRKMQHVRTSGWYRITGIHYLEADMSVVFTYQTLHREPVSFCRPIAELLDGRFSINDG